MAQRNAIPYVVLAAVVLTTLVMASILALVQACKGYAPGISAVYPPLENERAKAGTDFFLVCSCDRIPGQNRPMGLACLYEYRPGDTRLVKRAELAPSDWTPDPELVPEFLRQQMPRTDSPYDTWLYWVDYRTWQVRRVLTSDMIFGVAANERRSYFHTDKGVFVFDRQTLAVSESEAIASVVGEVQDGIWILKFKDEADPLVHLFDFTTETDLGILALPEGYNFQGERPQLSPKRDFVAFYEGLGWAAMQKLVRQTVTSRFVLCDLATGTSRALPVVVYVAFRPTSGIPSEFVKLDWGFTPDGASFRYVSAKKEGETAPDVTVVRGGWEEVFVESKDGQVTRKPSGPPAEPMSVPQAFYIPPYLDGRNIHHARDVVSGLLDTLGIEHNVRYGPNGSSTALTAAYTPDGKQFLALIPLPNGESRWMYGDIEGQKVIQVEAPPSVRIPDVHALVVPGNDVPRANGLPRYIGD